MSVVWRSTLDDGGFRYEIHLFEDGRFVGVLASGTKPVGSGWLYTTVVDIPPVALASSKYQV
jgi:hypothetical protein